jgi:hypothetical protein
VSVQLYRSLDFLKLFSRVLTGKEYDDAQITEALVRTWEEAPADTRKNGWHIRHASIRYLGVIYTNRATARLVARWSIQAMGGDTPLAHAYPLFRALVELRGVRPWNRDYYVSNAFGHRLRRGERRRPDPQESS